MSNPFADRPASHYRDVERWGSCACGYWRQPAPLTNYAAPNGERVHVPHVVGLAACPRCGGHLQRES